MNKSVFGHTFSLLLERRWWVMGLMYIYVHEKLPNISQSGFTILLQQRCLIFLALHILPSFPFCFVLFLSLFILATVPCVQCTVALICMSQMTNDENFFWVLTGHLKYLFKSFGMFYWIPHCIVSFFFKFPIYSGNRLLIDIFTANNFSEL